MSEFNQEKLKKILYESKFKPEWEEWKQYDREVQEAWIEKAQKNYSKIGYPDPETYIARGLMRD